MMTYLHVCNKMKKLMQRIQIVARSIRLITISQEWGGGNFSKEKWIQIQQPSYFGRPLEHKKQIRLVTKPQ